MAEEITKFPGKAEENKISRLAEWRPLGRFPSPLKKCGKCREL
jgi:hypothetical protein